MDLKRSAETIAHGSQADFFLGVLMKKIISLISVFILIFSLFCVPSFAYSSLPIITRDNITTSGLIAGKYQNQNVYLGLTQNPYSVPYYLFYYQAGTNTNFVLCTKYTEAPESSNLNQIEFAHQVGTGTFLTSLPNKTNSLLGVTPPSGIYYTNWNTTANLSNFNSAIDTYTSLADGFAAANSILTAVNPNTPPQQDWGTLVRVAVAPGNVAYIGVTGGNVSASVQTSSKFSGSYSSNIRYGRTSTLPDSSSNNTLTFDSSFGSALVFTAVQPFDILGRSSTGSLTLHDVGSTYLVFYNPLYDSDGNLNPIVYLHSNNFFGVVQYPLTANVVNGSISSSGSSQTYYLALEDNIQSDGNLDYTYYNYDSSSDSFVTSSAITVPTGGNNTYDTDPDNSLGGFLERILSIFTAPIKYIQQLFDSGSVFMGWLNNIFVWLPDEVSSVLISALVVLIVVGTIKTLWK